MSKILGKLRRTPGGERAGGDPETRRVDDLIRSAQHNAKVGALRLPILVVVSSFLFVFAEASIAIVWLSVAVLADRVSTWLRLQVAAGNRGLADGYLASVAVISACWMAHALLIWMAGDELAHLVALIDLFMVTIYGVTGGHKSLSIMATLVVPPLGAFLWLILNYLWTDTDFVSALCGSAAAVGACIAVLLTAFATHLSDSNLHQANMQLRITLAELDERRLEAEAASSAKNQFVALMSHEIRTPMNGVIGMLEVLRRSSLTPAQMDHAEVATKSARDLLHLLDDIIDVSRLETKQIAIDAAPFEPSALVADAIDLFSLRAREKGVSLSAEISPHVPAWVSGDRSRLRQVVTNLVGNALKFTETGDVTVTADYDAGLERLLIGVRDTGIGLKPEAAGRIFEAFFQVSSTPTREYSGSGLGLSICKHLVEIMGGEISVASSYGKGSLFSFWVPAPEAEPVAGPGAMDDPISYSRPLQILIAEDHPASQKILGALLGEIGHTLTFVSNGKDAVAAVAAGNIDVVIMDVMMPVMDGPTATQRIRELGGRAGGIPVIALTANALSGDRDRYIAAGMTDYLSKPIDVAALFQAIDRAAGLRVT